MDKIIAEVLKEHKIVRYVKTFVEVMEAYKQRLFELNEKPVGQVQLEQRVRQLPPFKPIRGGDSNMTTFACECGNDELIMDEANYCFMCGRQLDWSEWQSA